MRKLLFVLVLCLCLCACDTQTQEVKTPDYIIESAKDVDMSNYPDMSDYNHHFKSITASEMLEIINLKKSGLFYLGSTSCAGCMAIIDMIEKAASDEDVTIYYIDVYDENLGFRESLDYIMKTLDPILGQFKGEKVVQTPHVFGVVNGEFIDSQVGFLADFDYSSQSRDDMYKRYCEIFASFKKVLSD